jgi:hypothetical protein
MGGLALRADRDAVRGARLVDLGRYTYELHNIPVYVPPGHALVYVFGITAAGLPVVRRHGWVIRRLVILVATAWVVAGPTVLPWLTGRLDLQGAAVWPLLAWCLLRSGKGDMFAAIWVAVATIEIAGTWAGDWVWEASAPVVSPRFREPALRDRRRLRRDRRVGGAARPVVLAVALRAARRCSAPARALVI